MHFETAAAGEAFKAIITLVIFYAIVWSHVASQMSRTYEFL